MLQLVSWNVASQLPAVETHNIHWCDCCFHAIASGLSFSSNPAACSAFSLCSFSVLLWQCMSGADSWLLSGQFCTRAGFRQRKVWLLARASRLVVVVTTESLKIVFEKTELKVNAEPKSDSCTGDLEWSAGTTVGSLGGLTGGMGSGSLWLLSTSGCCWLAVSSCLLLSSETWTEGGSVVPATLQSLFTLERLDDPSAVEMTLLALGRLLGDLGPLSRPSFPTGVEKQLRQPDIEDDLPWTYNTVIGEQTEARVISALLDFKFTPLSSGFILTAPAESDERRVTFPLDPLRMLFVPLASQKSWESLCFGVTWISRFWLLVMGTEEAFSFCFCSFSVCWGVEVSLGGW